MKAHGFTITVNRSLSDGVIVIHIDGSGDDGEDGNGPKCRVYLNDGELHENPPYSADGGLISSLEADDGKIHIRTEASVSWKDMKTFCGKKGPTLYDASGIYGPTGEWADRVCSDCRSKRGH